MSTANRAKFFRQREYLWNPGGRDNPASFRNVVLVLETHPGVNVGGELLMTLGIPALAGNSSAFRSSSGSRSPALFIDWMLQNKRQAGPFF